ncbi:MAG: CehA/McbA family metallohydrolase [Deltaproteobacteria bacterium]|nr:CehA/McbA family metallohydrolase [Deltaproteobacteria bacterium]
MNSSTAYRLFVLLASVPLVLVGCGDDSSPTDAGPDTSTVDANMPDAGDAGGGDAGDAGPVDCVMAGVIEGATSTGPGPDSIGGDGDLEVTNGLFRAVFDAVDRPALLARSGGNLVDLHFIGESDNFEEFSQLGSPAQAFQVTYSTLEVAEQDAERVLIRSSGFLDPQPKEDGSPRLTPDPGEGITVVTEYEIRCGDPRIRVSSTLTNTTSDIYAITNGFHVLDFVLWGGSSGLPFCPTTGQGDRCTEFDSSDPLSTIVRTPYVGSTGSLLGDGSTYAYYPASIDEVMGVHGPQVSAIGSFGIGIGLLRSGESSSYDRVLVLGHESDVASAVDTVLDDLAGLGRMEVGTVSGTVTLPAGESFATDPRRRPLIVLAQPDASGSATDPATWTPYTMVRVQADGSFSARMPIGAVSYEIRAMGRDPIRAAAGDLAAGATLDLPITLPAAPSLDVTVTDGTSGVPSRVVVVGTGATPTPDFGSTFGGSPAMNTALTDGDGLVSLPIPAGSYDVYAGHGVNWSLARQSVTVAASGASVSLTIVPVGVVPAGFITGDFHVHSGASFDSSLPIEDRVMAYLAEGVQAVVSTEHDVIFDYAPALATVEEGLPPSWQGKLRTYVGLESTTFVPWTDFIHTIGHYNAFPLRVQPGAHKSGAPADEFVDPGTLYERLRALPSPVASPVVQLNHGRSDRRGSIWLGYFDSCGFDPTLAIDSTGSCFMATGPSGTRAWDVDAMEVINGKDVSTYIGNMRDWLALLRASPDGRRPVGTANSDSHRLVTQEAGYPVTFVKTDVTLDALSDDALVTALESGAVAGGTGVFVWAEVCQTDGSGCVEPGTAMFPVTGGTAQVHVTVAAPPWVPVDEIRVRLGGEVVQRLSGADLSSPSDPFGTTGVVRYDGTVDLTGITEDSFVVVEAGFALPRVGDLDADGVVDATDNDGNGIVDAADETAGGVVIPAAPTYLDIMAPGAHAMGFVNPVYLDTDANGTYDAPSTPFSD